MNDAPPFLFVTCQVGAERAVKAELARAWPAFRFAFSRPGFLTFKLPADHGLAEDFALGSVFARAYGFSLGSVPEGPPEEMARHVWRLAGERSIERAARVVARCGGGRAPRLRAEPVA